MALDRSPRTKTQTLSLRLDPKTRFVLEFLAKLNRQSITTVVEDAIRAAGADGTLPGIGKPLRTWRGFWDVSEGVRRMLLLADDDFPSDYEDDELREFIKWHIEFFSETNRLSDPDRINVEILWPRIEEFVALWLEKRRSDPWTVGFVMAEALELAEIRPPHWPRPTKQPPQPSTGAQYDKELGDEIPF